MPVLNGRPVLPLMCSPTAALLLPNGLHGLFGSPATCRQRSLNRICSRRFVNGATPGRFLRIPQTGLPAVYCNRHTAKEYIAIPVPQRLPSTSALASVTLSVNTVWVRTEDGRLWIAPRHPDHGLSWGYRGAGPTALAVWQPAGTEQTASVRACQRRVAHEGDRCHDRKGFAGFGTSPSRRRFRQQDPILDTQLESRLSGSDLTAPILNSSTEPTPPMQRAGPPPRPSQPRAEHGT
jgi:hypothetical protein